MARRLLALAVALLMIAGALALRNRIDDNDAEGPGGDGSGPLELVCATELRAACEALAADNDDVLLTVQPAGVTAARLTAASGPPDFDGWLVEAPWPEIVDQSRARVGSPAAFGKTSDVLARSPLVLAMWNDRLAAIEDHCEGGALTWKCIGEVAGDRWTSLGGEESWGNVKPGFADPASDGVGALVLGQAAVSYFGRTDLSTADFADDGFLRWIRQLATAVPQFPTFDDMLTIGVAAVDVVGTTEAQAGPGVAASRDRDKITITYPAPMATADVVLASVADADGAERLLCIVSSDSGLAAIAAAGWRVPGQPSPVGVPAEPTLPDDSGLPPAGAIDALRRLWADES
jgi:Bacterial extracellular solute-binding protein